MMSDDFDILGAERPQTPSTLNDSTKKKKKPTEATSKRPEGMSREIYGLLSSDNKDMPSVLMNNKEQGYKKTKAQLGLKHVQSWKWSPFRNPARKDDAIFYHWQPEEDDGQEYPFAKFNKKVSIPEYTDDEYEQHLKKDGWTKKETDHLFDLCERFDLRFVIMHDRWDRSQFANRSVEDIKERYYEIYNILTKLRATGSNSELKLFAYDADHERRRKEQLQKLYDRTPEQVEEEQYLQNELHKIELRKKEREKKTQDLQKQITASEDSIEIKKKKAPKRKVTQQKSVKANIAEAKKYISRKIALKDDPNVNPLVALRNEVSQLEVEYKSIVSKYLKLQRSNVDSAGIKFADFKGSGVSMRSHRMRLPTSLGTKKSQAIRQLLNEMIAENNSLHYTPTPTKDVCIHFNELRNDMLLLIDLKSAVDSWEFELQTLTHRAEALSAERGKEKSDPL